MKLSALVLSACLSCGFGWEATDLRVEYLTAPSGVDVPSPRFSWIVGSSSQARGSAQASYRITMKAAGGALGASDALVWDSGTQTSSTAYLVPYEGKALVSDTQYQWTVESVSTSGETATATSTFRTGLFARSDWGAAEWITGGFDLKLLRTAFEVPASKTVVDAQVYVSGIGYHELWLNGKKVGDHRLDVGWTDYAKRVYYVSFGIADLLLTKKAATNVFGLRMGNGWFAQQGGQPGHHNAPPQVLLRAIIYFSDGSTQSVVSSSSSSSSSSWMAGPSPITYDSLYNGEHYDARLDIDGWASAAVAPTVRADGYANVTWSPAQAATTDSASSATVASQLFEPIRAEAQSGVRAPVSITEPKPGMFVVDFGQNMAGFVTLTGLRGAPGQNVTIKHAEVLMHPPYGAVDGTLYYGNLRSAQATDIYTMKGGSSAETYSPTFTQHGFRYCEVTGLGDGVKLTASMIKATPMHTDLRQTGKATFSSPLLNQIQSNTVWGQKSNVMSVPTDCDQRDERRGWMGDAALTAEECTYNFATGAFYSKWLDVVRDDQGADGHTTDFVPSIGSTGAGAPNWQSASPTVIWTLYRYPGDVRIVQDHWPALYKYLQYWDGEFTKHGIANFDSGFGDWVPAGPGKADGHLVGAFAYLHDMQLIEELAGAVGNTTVQAAVAAQRKAVGKAFHDHFKSATSEGCYGSCLQTEQAMALWLADVVVPAADLDAVINATAKDVLETHGMHTTSGIIGIKAIFEAMSRLGRPDIPVLMTQQTTYPSYGYMVHNKYEPATTLWELWNSPSQGPGMNSRNHIMFGSVSSWMYRHLCGLDVPAGSRGYDKLTIRPVGVGVPGGDVTSASCEVGTPRGVARSAWTGPSVPGNRHGNLTCAVADESSAISLACPAGTITNVTFARYGTPAGSCEGGGLAPDAKCDADISTLVASECVGKTSCSVECDGSQCDASKLPKDPCYGTKKRVAVAVACSAPPKPPSPAPPKPADSKVTLSVTVPVGSTAVVRVPLVPAVGLTSSSVVVTEGGKPIWSKHAFVPGVDGVSQGEADGDDAVLFTVTSGDYAFIAAAASAAAPAVAEQ